MPPGAMEGVPDLRIFIFTAWSLLSHRRSGTFFYSSRHVKATCEARDPVTRWTDRWSHCRCSVWFLWMAFSGLTMLIMPVAVHGVTPFFRNVPHWHRRRPFLSRRRRFFGSMPRGLCWKLDLLGWWLVLVVNVGLHGLIHHHFICCTTPIEMYRLMNYPQAQIDQIQKMGFFYGQSHALDDILLHPSSRGLSPLRKKKYFSHEISRLQKL